MASRRALPIAVAAVIVAVAVAGILRGDADVVFDMAGALSVLVAGALLTDEPGQLGNGRLLCLGALLLAGTDGGVFASEDSGEITWIMRWFSVVPLAWVLLRYPEPTLTSRWTRAFLVVIGVWATVPWVVDALMWDPVLGGDPEPNGWGTLLHDEAVRVPVHDVAHDVGVGLSVAFAGVLVRRWRRSRGLQRDAVRWFAVAGLVLTATVALRLAAYQLGPYGPWRLLPADVYDRLGQATTASLVVAPAALLVEAARRRVRRVRTIERILALGTDTGRVRDALATALSDPRLTLTTTTPDEPAPGRVQLALVTDDGTRVGTVDTDVSARCDPAWVRTVLAAGAVVLDRVRLHADLVETLDEVQRSRTRIVESAMAERRRVERDLHDGAQQHLLAVASSLGRVELAGGDAAARDAAVGDARRQLTETLAELRRLAHGIHPPVLTQAGLGAALAGLAATAPVAVDLDVPADLADARFPTSVEASAWYVASEAVANAAKHARCRRVVIGLRVVDGELVVSVGDDGVGGATRRPGGGLDGLVDRLDAVGGRLTLADGRVGTLVTAAIPCGS